MNKEPDAQGGNGNIYFDRKNNKARKFLRNTSSREKISRFKNEIEALKKIENLNIENIVKIKKLHLDEKNITNSYIEMDLYDGPLQEIYNLTKGNVKLTFRLILPVIKALNVLSTNNPAIYHRDLKPDNILYKNYNNEIRLYITDFGICYINDNNERLTQENIAMGARIYMAPEYEQGRVENVTTKGDIFSLGKIIWNMIIGDENKKLPYNLWYVDEFNLTKQFPKEKDVIMANIIIGKCLNINPEERWNYDELIMQIEIFLENTENSDVERKEKLIQFEQKHKEETRINQQFNIQLVNYFSVSYVEALNKLIKEYDNFKLLETLYNEYKQNSKDCSDYTTINVINNSAHYLYSKTFDGVYISIDYIPPNKKDKYCKIALGYSIAIKDVHHNAIIFYDKDNIVKYKDSATNEETSFNTNSILKFLYKMIDDYISD